MKNLTATELARQLSGVLDEVEHRGESFVVSRNGRSIAELKPTKKSGTVGDLLKLLEEYPPDPDWARDLAEARKLLYVKDRDWPA